VFLSGLRRLGSLPPLGLGAGPLGDLALDEDRARAVVHAALDRGLGFFDTARAYGASEDRLGRFLEGRKDVLVATKGGYGVEGVPDWTGATIRLGIERALATLRRETIDVFFLHSCPLDKVQDTAILDALDAALAAGRIRARGYSGDGEPLAWAVASGRFDVVECSVNIVDRAGLVHAGKLPIVAKRALMNGAFDHRERPGREDVAIYWDRLRARPFDPSPLSWPELALRFSAYADGVSCTLVGTTRPEHVAFASEAWARGSLDPELIARLERSWDPSWHGLV
jgi:aryl-alcohol dehydrogenase-like predicted oxidoreductase